MKRLALSLLIACMSAQAANLLGTNQMPTNTWVSIGTSNSITVTTMNGYAFRFVGYEAFRRVPALGPAVACAWTMHRIITSENDHAWVCLDYKTLRTWVQDKGELFGNSYMAEANHCMSGWDVDPVTSVSYGRCSNSPNPNPGAAITQQFMSYDFIGQAGRFKLPAHGPNFNMVYSMGVFEPAASKLVLHGGTASGSSPGTGEYDVNTNVWNMQVGTSATGTCNTLNNPTNCPAPGTFGHTMVYNSNNGKIYLFGGMVGSSLTASMDNVTTTMSVASGSYAKNGDIVTIITATVTERLLITAGGGTTTLTVTRGFGGTTPASHPNGAAIQILQNDIYAYTASTHTWEGITPSGTKPSARMFVSGAFMKSSNVIMIYGGGDEATQVINTDTWIFDPVALTWTQLATATSPTGATSQPFGRLVYFDEEDVAVVSTLAAGSIETFWALRLRTGELPGTVSVSPKATPNSLNRNLDSWAHTPSVSVNGTTINESHIESGTPTGTGGIFYYNEYAHSINTTTGAVTNLGSAYNSINSEAGEAYHQCSATIGGNFWVAYTPMSNLVVSYLYMKRWNPGTSTWIDGGKIPKGNPLSSNYSQGHCQLADVGGVPTIIWREWRDDAFPTSTYIYVAQWNGSAFVMLGSTFLNRDESGSTKTVGGNVAITSNGTNPVIAWQEWTWTLGTDTGPNFTPPHIYSSVWNGTTWTSQGGTISTSTNYADAPSIAFLGGQSYVAYTERTLAGLSNLFVKTFSGGVWSSAGTPPSACTGNCINKDHTQGWVSATDMVSDGTNLWLAWIESGNQITWQNSTTQLTGNWGSFAHRAQTYVAKWAGSGTWAYQGGSLNADTVNGSSQLVSITMVSGQPAVAWGEVKMGSLRGIYASKYNGSDWVGLGASSPLDIVTASLPDATSGAAYAPPLLSGSGGTPPYSWTVLSGTLPTGITLTGSTGALTGSNVTGTTQTFTIQLTDAVPNSVNQAFTITVNAALSVTTASLPNGTIGVVYSQTLVATGGTVPLTWSITSGALPSGLSLTASTGTISGTPTGSTSSNNIGFRVTDANGGIGDRTLNLTINSNAPVSSTIQGSVVIGGGGVRK